MNGTRIVLIFAGAVVGLVLLAFLWQYAITERFEAQAKKSSRLYDSLKREENYRAFVDSLTRERNKKQLEEYLKKHPSERPVR